MRIALKFTRWNFSAAFAQFWSGKIAKLKTKRSGGAAPKAGTLGEAAGLHILL
jgi:hypothetical protein